MTETQDFTTPGSPTFVNEVYRARLLEVIADGARRGEIITVTKVGHKYIYLQSSNGTSGKLFLFQNGFCSWNLHKRFNSFNPARRA